ncbi:hypothetical protein H5410_002069 [Solanum commersonii]|uniref:G-patch domain-containing protein n=1 Tax=Solanum commersonii TaxID=4109 RepID=A0A9J6B0X1_SOLCO|nr:hypothetical protein H5410_002069 [Solanum commersonii]
MLSLAQPIITVQLREPLTVQTYLPRVIVTTLIARELEYDTTAVPWDYRAELSHPTHSVNSIPITDELDGATFHTLEIMQAIRVNEEAEPEDTKLSSASKMYGYQPKSGLGPKSNGIVKPIQLKHQRGTNGLGYEPTLGRFHQGATLIPDQAGVDNIIEGIGDLLLSMVEKRKR